MSRAAALKYDFENDRWLTDPVERRIGGEAVSPKPTIEEVAAGEEWLPKLVAPRDAKPHPAGYHGQGRPRGTYKPTKLTHRGQIAVRLLASGACRTFRQAGRAAGISEVRVSQIMNSSEGREYMDSVIQLLEHRVIDMNAVLDDLSMDGLAMIHGLMKNASKEDVQLRAAIDLADRGPRTGKVQKTQNDTFILDARAVVALQNTMREAELVRERYKAIAAGESYVRVQDPLESLPSPPSVEELASESAEGGEEG